MPKTTSDLYLNDITGEQAVKAVRQAAFIMLNGGEYEPVGHEGLDGLIYELLWVADQWSKATVREWKSDG